MIGVPAGFIAFMSAVAGLVGLHLTLSPASPVEIFVAQFTEAFGHPPALPARPATRPIRKRVYISRP